MMSETTSVGSDDKIGDAADQDLMGTNPAFPAHFYRPFLEELCEQTKFTKSEIRFLYRGFKQVRTKFTWKVL